jgi:hypothetical protein
MATVVTTPPIDAIFYESEPQDIIEHDAEKPTPTNDGIFGTDERQDTIEQDTENGRQALRRLHKAPYLDR